MRRFFLLSAGGNADPKVFAIPPHDPNWESLLTVFNQDVELVGLQAHMPRTTKYPRAYLQSMLSHGNVAH